MSAVSDMGIVEDMRKEGRVFKTCPFCDCPLLAIRWNKQTERSAVQCRNCLASGPQAETADEAQEKWNVTYVRKPHKVAP